LIGGDIMHANLLSVNEEGFFVFQDNITSTQIVAAAYGY
jgi:hypothetical protein